MGRTACTEPQCLYKGALHLTLQVDACIQRDGVTSDWLTGSQMEKLIIERVPLEYKSEASLLELPCSVLMLML
jgi:hypothetical protein